MLQRFALVGSLIGFVLFAGSAFGEMNMREGMWEMTMKTEMPGMRFEIPPMKFNQCMTKKDVVPQRRQENKDCQIKNTKIEGNTVSWHVQCSTKDGTVDGTGKITYRGDSFDGVMKTVSNNGKSGKMEMTQHMSGRRIGDCK